VWNEYKQVDQDFVSRRIDLKVFKEHIDSKELESLINDILTVDRIEREISRSIIFSFDWNDRKSTGSLGLKRLIVCWMLGLELICDLPFGV
jgi:hypothetical protein